MDGRRGLAISALTLLAVVAVDVVGARAMGFSVKGMNLEYRAAAIMLLASALYFVGGSRPCRDLRGFASPRLWAGLAAITAYLITFSVATLIMQSLAVSYHAPLVDDALIRTDTMLGFSWPALARWYGNHPVIAVMSWCVYQLWGPQIVLTCALFAVMGRWDRLHEFLALFFLATAVSIALSAEYPATNPLIHYGLVDPHGASLWSQFAAFRDGLRVIDISERQGLVSMPSMHAAAAVLFAYAVRGIRFVLPASIAANAAMALSALFIGAHYLIDVLAGVGLAVLLMAISYAARRLRLGGPRSRWRDALAMVQSH